MAKKKTVSNSPVLAEPVFKPSLYMDDSQIPKHIGKAQVGDKVKIVVEGRVVSKSERNDAYTGRMRKSVSLDIDKMKPVSPPSKTAPVAKKQAPKTKKK